MGCHEFIIKAARVTTMSWYEFFALVFYFDFMKMIPCLRMCIITLTLTGYGYAWA